MRWLILSLLFSSYTYSQVFVQTFTDRCTGELKTIVIPFEGSTVVAFYNQSRSFTINEVRTGELQAWLEEVYAWWQNISPCSVNQATATATQTTTSNATQNATATATGSTGSPPQGGNSQNQTSNNESSSSTTESTSDQSGGSDSGDNSSSEGDSGEGSDSDSEPEEGSEGESEDDGEDSDDGEESEEEDSKGSNKKVNPIIVAANVATMSALDGSVNFVTNVGLSQSSLSGIYGYSANLMVWDNLQQYNLNLSRSTSNKEPVITLYTSRGPKVSGGELVNVSSSSINLMYSFGMFNISYGKSKVYIMNKGLVGGWAASAMAMKSYNDYTFLPTLIGFATKPYLFDRVTISPMIAIAFNPIMYTTIDSKLSSNINAIFVAGYSGSFNLTKNFYMNLGFSIVESTANLPLTWAATIGSRFQF